MAPTYDQKKVYHNHHPAGPQYNLGNHYKGKHYTHWCFDRQWTGYTKKVWYARGNCYRYWYPAANCWYQFDGLVYHPVKVLCACGPACACAVAGY